MNKINLTIFTLQINLVYRERIGVFYYLPSRFSHLLSEAKVVHKINDFIRRLEQINKISFDDRCVRIIIAQYEGMYKNGTSLHVI